MNTELILQHGLTLGEYEVIHNYLQRELTMEELGIFSAMWNEHCCYKTSKKWLKKLPTSNDIVFKDLEKMPELLIFKITMLSPLR